MDKQNDFLANLRSLAGQWKTLLALVVVVAFAAVYLERKLFPASAPAVTGVTAEAQLNVISNAARPSTAGQMERHRFRSIFMSMALQRKRVNNPGIGAS